MAIIGGIIGIIIGVLLLIYGFKGGTIIVQNDQGQAAPVSGSPNWVMIILGAVIAISSIVAMISASK